MTERPVIDLNPNDWQSSENPRKRKREPILGPNAPFALAHAIGWVVTFSLLYYFRH